MLVALPTSSLLVSQNILIDCLTVCFCSRISHCYQGHFTLTRVFIGSVSCVQVCMSVCRISDLSYPSLKRPPEAAAFVFIGGSYRCRFLALTRLTFLSCRRPFFLIFSPPSSPPSTLYINYPIPLQRPPHSIILLICLFLSTYNICFFFVLFRPASSSFLSELLIDFFLRSTLPLIFSCLCFSPTHHQLNKPSPLPSLSPS